MKSMTKPLQVVCVLSAALFSIAAARASAPQPVGKMVDLGGHKLHLDCTGHGAPTVVVETGLGDFSFDWDLVQSRVSHFTRICTYDRAGYAWSDPGPKPRTFAQINLELHDALQKLGERGPFVLVGHSYGGPVVRNFAAVYPHDVAALVLVDSAVEGMRVGVGGKQTIQLGVNVKPREIPAPRETLNDSDKPQAPARRPASASQRARAAVQEPSSRRAEAASLGPVPARCRRRRKQPARVVGTILRPVAGRPSSSVPGQASLCSF